MLLYLLKAAEKEAGRSEDVEEEAEEDSAGEGEAIWSDPVVLALWALAAAPEKVYHTNPRYLLVKY